MKLNPMEIAPLFKKRLSPIISKRLFKIIFILPVLLAIGTTIGITVYFSELPPQVPLFYSKPWGEEQLTQPLYLYLLPLGSIVWQLATSLLIVVETYQYRVFAQLLLIFSLLVSLLSTYAITMILILVL